MSNYVTEFTAQYVGVLNKTQVGDYSNNGAEYHLMLSAYDTLMSSIEKEDAKSIRMQKNEFEKALNKVQQNIIKAWEIVFPQEGYSKQNTIHGLNIVITKLNSKLAEAEKL